MARKVSFYTQAEMVRYIVPLMRHSDGGAVYLAFGRAVLCWALAHGDKSILAQYAKF